MNRQLKFINDIENNSFVKKHLIDYTWISGENTIVYPIKEWIDRLEIQWNTDRPCKKWIDKIVNQNKDLLEYGYFSKSDGSCPSYICFVYKDKYKHIK